MFNADFFPTPPEVIEMMISGLNLKGKHVWEPEAGRCDIVKRLIDEGAHVIACEKDQHLIKIVQSYCPVIAPDMLTVKSDQVSHVEYIIMNPPFSDAARHILHAYEIAPAGCKVIALCNSETLKNAWSKSREELKNIVDSYGQSQDLGDCFSKADRRTDVNVTLIRLEKPGANYDAEFEGFFMDEEPEEIGAPGIMSYNVVRDIVNRYVEAIKIFDEQLRTAEKLNDMTGEFFGATLGMKVTKGEAPIQRNQFKKDLQKAGWAYIFSKLNMAKHATKGLKEDINKFVETQEGIPFTMRNIYHMLNIVIGTTGQRMDKAIVEVFDRVTKYHADNRMGLPGWKTNSHFLLTKRFIIPSVTTVGWEGKVDTRYDSDNFQMLEDMVKALCFLNGDNYDEKVSLYDFISYPYLVVRDGKYVDDPYYTSSNIMCKSRSLEEATRKAEQVAGTVQHNQIVWGQWIDWGFFRFRCYKKGTAHLEFKDDSLWGRFNQHVSKLKGYPLFEKKEQTAYQARQTGRKQNTKAEPKTKPVILNTIQL
jgi:hypothetical protein